MTVGERIRALRKAAGLTQTALGEKLGVKQATVGQYENNPNPPKIETLQRIADALEVPVGALLQDMYTPPRVDWLTGIEQKMAHIGFSIGYYEEDAVLWINYPDGTLEVSEADLKELDANTDFFLKYQLETLKDKYRDRFKQK